MDAIKRELTSDKPELIAERDSRSVIRAVVDLLKKGLNEQVHPVKLMFKSFIASGNNTCKIYVFRYLPRSIQLRIPLGLLIYMTLVKLGVGRLNITCKVASETWHREVTTNISFLRVFCGWYELNNYTKKFNFNIWLEIVLFAVT